MVLSLEHPPLRQEVGALREKRRSPTRSCFRVVLIWVFFLEGVNCLAVFQGTNRKTIMLGVP